MLYEVITLSFERPRLAGPFVFRGHGAKMTILPGGSLVKLTVIADNYACRPELATQHGLSFWIEYAGRTLLFDTGSDASFLANAAALGIRNNFV